MTATLKNMIDLLERDELVKDISEISLQLTNLYLLIWALPAFMLAFLIVIYGVA